ncbi:MAG: hypothetical protein RLZZ58_450 [Pseudomonadota bacterium]
MNMEHYFTRGRAFPMSALAMLKSCYPLRPEHLLHSLTSHAMLSADAIAELAGRMDPADVEFNRADNLPIGIRPEDVPANGLSIVETIRSIETNKSWAVLKNIEKDDAYRALLLDLLEEIRMVVEPQTGPMLTPQGFIFISSPGSMTPFHFDPEHNILMQIRGEKAMHVFPAGDPAFAAPQDHERYHSGGSRNLDWNDGMARGQTVVALHPGEAIHVPVMAPHYVRNGAAVSVSLSITWRSTWSYREAEAHAANKWLRKFGLNPGMPPRWPRHAVVRSTLWRALRRFGVEA